MTEKPDQKFIVELLKNYKTLTIAGYPEITGGEWEAVKDEFGNELIFDYFFLAYRELQGICPSMSLYGGRIGRVKEVEMINRKNKNG